jgi:transposase
MEVETVSLGYVSTPLKELYNAGVSPTEISDRVGVSRRTIFNWAKQRGF